MPLKVGVYGMWPRQENNFPVLKQGIERIANNSSEKEAFEDKASSMVPVVNVSELLYSFAH